MKFVTRIFPTHCLLDIFKAFDTVRRKDPFDILKEILDEDEIHIIMILVEDVKLGVRVGKNLRNKITTNIKVPQGDCLSPILFTIHQVAALKQTKTLKYLKPSRTMTTQSITSTLS